MATVRISTFPSATDAQIVQAVGSATATSNIELTCALANTMDGSTRPLQKDEVILALRRLIDYILQGGKNGGGLWPPQ